MRCDVLIRTARPADAAGIARVLREAFSPFEKLYTPAAFAATILDARRVRERFADQGRIWVASENKRAVGTVSAVDEGERLYIRSMAVSPAAQGIGIGQRLLGEVEKFALKKGFAGLFLYTTPFLAGAIRLYEKNGFEHGGDVDGFFGTPLLEMEKRLDVKAD